MNKIGRTNVVSRTSQIQRLPVLEDEARWEEAAAKMALVNRVLAAKGKLSHAIEAVAADSGITGRTLWAWLKAYRTHGISGLLNNRGYHLKGKSRLHPETEKLTADVIASRGMTQQKRRPSKVHEAVVQACMNNPEEVRPPSYATVRRRMAAVNPREFTAAREGAKTAREKFDQVQRSFTHLTRPLEVIQIDHWEANIIVVDEETCTPIGRPWVSVALDVFSRCVCGLFVTIAAPCSASTATCLARTIKPKTEWLASHSLDLDWPCHGIMQVLHTDNADDLVGHAVTRGCAVLGIEQHPRRKGRAADGGHIERFFRTLSEQIHTLPGTTFANPRDRGSYDSEGNARLTVLQLERYIATWIGEVYHHSRHTELGCTPYERWHSVEPYRHAAELDETLVNILFLPFRQVTVTRAGIRLFNMVYQADVLRRWIGVKRDDLCVNYDPRDMSRVYFFDPDLKRYFAIACHDMRMPAPTLAQVQGVAKTIRRKGERISPRRLADALNRLDAIVSEAETKAVPKPGTKAARRKREAAKRPADTTPVMAAEKASPVLNTPVDDFADGPVNIYHAEIMRSGK